MKTTKTTKTEKKVTEKQLINALNVIKKWQEQETKSSPRNFMLVASETTSDMNIASTYAMCTGSPMINAMNLVALCDSDPAFKQVVDASRRLLDAMNEGQMYIKPIAEA